MDRRTFLKASGAAVAVAAAPSLPAFGADGPKAWRDLVEWCKEVPNLQGYMTGFWTQEYDLGDGTSWVGMADSLVIAPAFSPEEACASMKAAITQYIGNDTEAVWWRALPRLLAFWYVEEGAAPAPPDQWVERVALLERPHYALRCRIAAFGANRHVSALRKEGQGMQPDRKGIIKSRCGVVDTIFRDPWASGTPLPVMEWHADPPPGAKMCQSAEDWAALDLSEWSLGKVRMSKRLASSNQFTFLEGAPS